MKIGGHSWTKNFVGKVIYRMALLIIVVVFSRTELDAADSIKTVEIVPGVMHTTIIKPDGPWVIHAVTIDLTHPCIELSTLHAFDLCFGREKTTSIARRSSSFENPVVAAINGDFFELKSGETVNNMVSGGTVLWAFSYTGSWATRKIRSQFALSADNRPHIEQFVFKGKIFWPNGSAEDLCGINTRPDSNGAVLYNHYYGNTTPRDTAQHWLEEIQLSPAGTSGDTLLFQMSENLAENGGTFIDHAGCVISGSGNAAARIKKNFSAHGSLKILLGFSPAVYPIQELLGGIPQIVRTGKNVCALADSLEGASKKFSETRHPRSGIGFTADSTKLLLVTVDGRQKQSVGMSLPEFADLMISMGISNGLNFDGGGSTTMVVNGEIVNSPSDAEGERPVANALIVKYREK